MKTAQHVDTAVVGGGVVGHFSALSAPRDHSVALLRGGQQHALRASQGDTRRSIPQAPGSALSAIKFASDLRWMELARQCPDLLQMIPTLTLTTDRDADTLQKLQAAGALTLGREQLAHEGRHFRLTPESVGLWFPDTYIMRPERALDFVAKKVSERSAGQVIDQEVKKIDRQDDGSFILHQENGERIHATYLILASGRWTAELLQSSFNISIPLKATKQDTFWFAGSDTNQGSDMPVTVDLRGNYFVFPRLGESPGIKLFRKGYGPEVAVDSTDALVADEATAQARAYATSYLAQRDLDIVAQKVCWHARSIDGKPYMGPIPGVQNASAFFGCNGEAFTWGPRLGELLISMAQGQDLTAIPPELLIARALVR